MDAQGWMRLVARANSFRGNGRYSIPAYSEFMPAPRLLRKPYGETVATTFAENDPWGWPISEYIAVSMMAIKALVPCREFPPMKTSGKKRLATTDVPIAPMKAQGRVAVDLMKTYEAQKKRMVVTKIRAAKLEMQGQ